MVRLDVQRLCHEANDVGLRDGLVVSDREGRIAVSSWPQRFRYEQVTWHAEDRTEHARVANIASLELLVDHADALGIEAAACALKFDCARALDDGDDKNRP